MTKRRAAPAPERILRAVVLPTLGALLGSVACERNPFVARAPGAAALDAGATSLQPPPPVPPGTLSVQTVGATAAPALPMPYLGLPTGHVASPPLPPGRYLPHPHDGGATRPPPPGRVLPPATHDAGAPSPPGLVPPPRPPGRVPPPGVRPRPGPAATDNGLSPSRKPSPEARAEGRRLGRTRPGDGGRDPGCAGAGALRRRGPT